MMTIDERIYELKRLINKLRIKKNCNKCDKDEQIYQYEQEIKRLEKMK